MTVAIGARPTTMRRPTSASIWPSRRVDSLRNAGYVALCVVVFTIPWQDILQLGGLGTITRLVGALALVIGLIAVAVGGRRHRAGDFILLAVAFAVWVTLSLFWTAEPSLTLGRIQTIWQIVALLYLAWEFAESRNQIDGLLAAWVLGGFVLGFAAIATFSTGVTAVRYSASGTNPNDLALLMCLGVPIAWYLGLRSSRRAMRTIYRLYLPFAAFVVVISASREALITLAVALLIVPATAAWTRASVKATAIAGALLIVGVGLSALPQSSLQRLGTLSSAASSGANGRYAVWRIGLNLVQHHPVVGVGAGSSRTYVQQYFVREAGLHDTYLSVLVELGAVGLVLFLLVFLAAARPAMRSGGLTGRFATVMVFTLIVGLVPLHWDYVKGTWVVLLVLALSSRRALQDRAFADGARPG
jgi:O-antigen ligase